MKEVFCVECNLKIKVPIKCNVKTRCEDCKKKHNSLRDKLWRLNNPERIEYEKNWKKNWWNNITDEEKADFYTKRKQSRNYKKLKSKHDRTYRNKHRERINKDSKEKYNSDNFYRHRCLIRSRIRSYILRTSDKKYNSDIFKIIGLSVCDFRNYISNLFEDDMNWSNYGVLWEIDHIKPLIYAKSVEEIYSLSHYTNLRPLYKKENLEKGGKYNAEDTNNL